jgi:hypothetical protein
MRGYFIAVRLDPDDLNLQQRNPCPQFILRIGIEQFLRQQAGSITFCAGQIIIHVSQQNRTPRACCQRGKRVGRSNVAFGQQGTGKWLKRFHKP